MAVSRRTKLWIMLLAAPAVLVLGAALVLKLYFTNDRLKAILVPMLADRLQREVTLSSVQLSLFPVFALEADSLVLANREGFSPRPLLSLDRLELQVRLLPLLSGNIDVTRVLLQAPRLLVEYDEHGAANYETRHAGGSPPESDASTPSALGGGSALLSDVRIENGRIEYVDRSDSSAMTFEAVTMDLRAEVRSAAAEIRVVCKGVVEDFRYGAGEKPLVSGLRLAVDQAFVYQPGESLLVLEHGTVTVQDIVLDVHGRVSQLPGSLRLDITCVSDSVNIAQLLSLVPATYREQSEAVKGEGAARIRIAVTGTVNDSTQADLAGTLSVSGARVQYAGLPKAITGVTLESDFVRTAEVQQFRITRFSALLGTDPVSAAMTLKGFDDPLLDITASARLNLATVKEYYPLDSSTVFEGEMNATLSLAGRASDQAAMRAAGSLTFRDVAIRTAGSTHPVQSLNGRVTFTNTVIESPGLSLTLGRSDLSLRFALRNYLSLLSDPPRKSAKNPPLPVATLSLTSNVLRMADLVTEEPASGQRGAGGAKSGGAKGIVLPGVAMDVEATVGRLELERFPLTDVRAAVTMRDSAVTLRSFSCTAFDGRATTSGTLVAKSPDRTDFDLVLALSRLEAGQVLSTFTSLGRTVSGRLTMNATLKGGLDDTLGLIPAALNGRATVRIEEGTLEGVSLSQELAAMLRLPELETVRFKDVSSTFTVADGKMVIRDMSIRAPETEYMLSGTHGLDGSLDYRLSVKLSETLTARASVPGFAGEAVGLFKDPDGRLRLDFTVGGMMGKPLVALDARAVREKADELARRKAEEGVKKVQDVIQDLFKKKK